MWSRSNAICAVFSAAFITGGCASSDRPKEVPRSANEVDAGKGMVHWTAAGEGRVFVSDSNRKELVYSGEMRQGQTIKVDAKRDRVELQDVPAMKRELLNHHTFKIYFDRAAAPASSVAQGNGKTVITVDSRSGMTTIEQR
jgi:hypothetical protein